MRDAVQPVARVAEARHDVALVVELLVERGGHDGDRDVEVAERLLQVVDTLGRGQEAECTGSEP